MGTLSKNAEIKLIEELMNSDSYFAQAFPGELERFRSNIRSDFSFLNGTEIENKLWSINEIQNELSEAAIENANFRQTVKTLNENLAVANDTTTAFAVALLIADNENSLVYSMLSIDEICKIKLKNVIKLTESEVQYMLTKLTK
ncbi:MAG: hypothetical protein WC979_02655 [Candidatus Pacearchaeota archaeon]|jgi:hypothetical protein|nr:hypothetical protein [Clostridia bacterium]